jgi:3-oxoacyl-[acyl-carrier protein] reductase
MDLHLAGRKAIVCASSQGLGRACATSLSREGVQVFINGRNEEKLATTAAEIGRETGQRVVPVVADIMTEEGRARLVAACPDADILVNNNAGPTPGKFEDWAREDYLKVFERQWHQGQDEATPAPRTCGGSTPKWQGKCPSAAAGKPGTP